MNYKKLLMLSTLALTSVSITQTAFAQAMCAKILTEVQVQRPQDFKKRVDEIIKARGEALPARSEVTVRLIEFAVENNLPAQWLLLGPAGHQTKRLFVALDHTNEALVKKYLETFNLSTAVGKNTAGTLALEFARENLNGANQYITGVLRPSADPDQPIYRWGRPDQKRSQWWVGWVMSNRTNDISDSGITAFGHLLELNASEKQNVDYYLANPQERAVCKSDNCVAWTSSIELGQTKKEQADDARKFLFNELGVSRSSAHFEIGRRLIHAANDRHTAVVTFVNGEAGLKNFQSNLKDYLVPDPKIPYASIIKNYKGDGSAKSLKAIENIKDGSRIFIPIAAGASPEGFNALISHAKNLKEGIEVHVLVNGISANDFKRAVEETDKINIKALFLGGNLRDLYQKEEVAVIPGNLADFNRHMRDPNKEDFKYDTILVRVSPANAEGQHSLGPNQDMIMSILKSNPDIQIIAEVNPNVPFTTGNNQIHQDRIAAKFESTSELAGPPVVPPSIVDAKIGMNLGSLVEKGSYLQIGIGNIFSGLPMGLTHHGVKNLKISTEMFGDPMMEMVQKGIATKAETGFAYGSNALYAWLNNNKNVVFRDTEYVNSPGRVSRLKKFHAINTALQVNLFGESNATMGPDGRISSPGGQVEFMSGAARSEGGKAIIAIRSTAKNGELSTIVLDLYDGPITTPGESVTHVVTEYGIANLAGKSEAERAVALINIAHPKFRKELADKALEKEMIEKTDYDQINFAQEPI